MFPPVLRVGLPGGTSRTYELQAVVYHRGRGSSGGHYVTAFNSRGSWYLANDAQVTRTAPHPKVMDGEKPACSRMAIYAAVRAA